MWSQSHKLSVVSQSFISNIIKSTAWKKARKASEAAQLLRQTPLQISVLLEGERYASFSSGDNLAISDQVGRTGLCHSVYLNVTAALFVTHKLKPG